MLRWFTTLRFQMLGSPVEKVTAPAFGVGPSSEGTGTVRLDAGTPQPLQLDGCVEYTLMPMPGVQTIGTGYGFGICTMRAKVYCLPVTRLARSKPRPTGWSLIESFHCSPWSRF